MAQLKNVVEPFGEVNVHSQPDGSVRVWASILMEPDREGTQTGIALDGSGSMRKLYGQDTGGGVLSPIFAKPKVENIVTPVAQQLCAYLARKIDSDHGTTCIYWATGNNGSQIEVVGDLTADQAEQYPFKGPHDFGTGTQLLPAVRYFVDRFKDAPWGFFVFVTDGELFDLDEVKRYSTQLARDRRGPAPAGQVRADRHGSGCQREAARGARRSRHGHRDRPVGPQDGRRDAHAPGDFRGGRRSQRSRRGGRPPARSGRQGGA